MATVSIIFDRRRTASKTKNGSVELVINLNGRQKIISTGVRVKKHEWKNGMVVGRGDTPDTYKLIPTNNNFPAQDIPIDMILHVYKVLGCIKRF